MHRVDKFIIAETTQLKHALVTMDKAGEGFLIVADSRGSIVGVVADGDVRRALIGGTSLDVPVSSVMNRDFKFWRHGSPHDEAIKYLKTLQCRQLPILDDANKPIDIIFSDHLEMPRRDNGVVVMAGGLGTRLRPITANVPKPMLRIGDKPFLQNTLENLIEQGFHKFYFCVNYLADQIIDHFGDGSRWDVSICYVREKKQLGTAGALALIDYDSGLPLLVMNGDLATKLDFTSLIEYHASQHYAATMAVRSADFQVPFGVVEAEEGQVTGIVEKPIRTYLVNAGIYVIDPDCRRRIPKNESYDMPTLLEDLIRDKRSVGYFPLFESWIDIGRMEDYQRAMQSLLSKDGQG